MSDQDMEMQFADPDWQPTATRQSVNAREQPPYPYVLLDVHDAPRQQSDGAQDAYDRDKAGEYSDYSHGYKASSDQYQEPAQMPRLKARQRSFLRSF